MNPDLRNRVIATMSAQHGLVSIDQLRDAGLDRDDLRSLQRQRLIERVGPGAKVGREAVMRLLEQLSAPAQGSREQRAAGAS